MPDRHPTTVSTQEDDPAARMRISEYLIPGDPRRLGSDDITIRLARQLNGRELWAVRRSGNCMNRSSEWEYEPMPSSRDDEFLARCRFDSVEDAMTAIRKFLKAPQ